MLPLIVPPLAYAGAIAAASILSGTSYTDKLEHEHEYPPRGTGRRGAAGTEREPGGGRVVDRRADSLPAHRCARRQRLAARRPGGLYQRRQAYSVARAGRCAVRPWRR